VYFTQIQICFTTVFLLIRQNPIIYPTAFLKKERQREIQITLQCITIRHHLSLASSSGVPRNFFSGGCSTNSVEVEDRGQTECGSGGGSPLVRGAAQFAN
jgi:hypothetical protein